MHYAHAMRMRKDKPILYHTCKRMIERGSIEGMSTKLDVFYAAGKLIDDEYKELTELLYRSFWLSL